MLDTGKILVKKIRQNSETVELITNEYKITTVMSVIEGRVWWYHQFF